MISQTNVLTTLAYLLGERSVNSTTSAPRADFIQETLNEAYAAYPWRFANSKSTITLTSGIATMPTNFDISHKLTIAWLSGTDEIKLEEIDPSDTGLVNDGDNAAWLEPLSTGYFTLNTKDTTPTSVTVKYQSKAPTLSDSVQTAYPNKMTLALGARRYVKLGQNPDADISQDEAIFRKRLDADIAAHQVPGPRKKRQSAQSRTGSTTGEW